MVRGFCFRPHIYELKNANNNSYTCGGVGHLSRDCSQGSKCYNCSGIVRVFCFVSRFCCVGVIKRCPFFFGRRRVTLAAIARSPRGVLATRVDQKGGWFHTQKLVLKKSDDFHSHISRDCPGVPEEEV
jgi:hypothetical protein